MGATDPQSAAADGGMLKVRGGFLHYVLFQIHTCYNGIIMIIPQLARSIKGNLTTFIIGFFLLDALSALAYFVIPSKNIIFFLLVISIFLLTLYRFEYGFLMAAAELFIGSKGYLFSFEYGETLISFRIAIFIILMSVFFMKCFALFRHRDMLQRAKDRTILPLSLCAAVLFFGLAQGLKHGYGAGNVFLDANGYFYIFLFFPLFYIIKKTDEEKFLKEILPAVLQAAALWLSIKTIILFTFFRYVGSHEIGRYIYLWVRNTVGEVTSAGDGLFRIFIQSQLYILISFIILLIIFSREKFSKRQTILNIIYGSIFLTALLISMSRSFWVGGLAALALYIVITAWKKEWNKIVRFVSGGVLCALGALAVLFVIYAPSLHGVRNRATIDAESAISSREAQMLPLLQEIKKEPFLGHGFGKTVTYKSSDPRILASNPTGVYTTSAFELGYLDIILKIGAVGLLLYLLFISKIVRGLLCARTSFSQGLFFGLVAILIIHAFSPYLNHPLGIGYLVLASLYRAKNST